MKCTTMIIMLLSTIHKPWILSDEDLEDWPVDYHFSNQSAQYSFCVGVPFQKPHS